MRLFAFFFLVLASAFSRDLSFSAVVPYIPGVGPDTVYVSIVNAETDVALDSFELGAGNYYYARSYPDVMLNLWIYDYDSGDDLGTHYLPVTVEAFTVVRDTVGTRVDVRYGRFSFDFDVALYAFLAGFFTVFPYGVWRAIKGIVREAE